MNAGVPCAPAASVLIIQSISTLSRCSQHLLAQPTLLVAFYSRVCRWSYGNEMYFKPSTRDVFETFHTRCIRTLPHAFAHALSLRLYMIRLARVCCKRVSTIKCIVRSLPPTPTHTSPHPFPFLPLVSSSLPFTLSSSTSLSLSLFLDSPHSLIRVFRPQKHSRQRCPPRFLLLQTSTKDLSRDSCRKYIL